ncbi:DMT family transporter [Jannaschia rubra]|uniref:DMT family transporter n=1 Tax=Jannaschia rubra TaxID=282197 RepID=UPI002490BF97|nr:DMT family transporter [Jannaschia rubra]
MNSFSPALLVPVAVVFVAGLGFGLQAPLNATLGRLIGSGLGAATVSFGVGFAALLVLTLVIGDPASILRAGGVSPLYWIGGFLGAVVVWAMLWSVPVTGVLTAISALLLGQLTAALLLDAVGAFGAPVHAITPQRVLAMVMVAGGLILSRF